ncbi:MAG: hypothetical protein ACT4P6_21820 [Gemmatimonadaceae bacterium]
MIRVERKQPTGDEWDALQKRVRAGKKRLQENFKHGETPTITDKIFQDHKPWLLEIFHNKCAYCETLIRPGYHGDVEHYRPKGKVVEQTEKGDVDVMYEFNGKPYRHPGYYWLAYDFNNLFPSCQQCNQRFKATPGKMNYFPLEDPAKRAWSEEMLAHEAPLLLDPCDTRAERDPKEHLEIDDTGAFIAKTKAGKNTIDVLMLNRDLLLSERLETYRTAQDKMLRLASAGPKEAATVAELQSELNGWAAGIKKYSAAAREAIRRTRAEIIARLG